MKKNLLSAVFLCAVLQSFSQNDTTVTTNTDTIKAGNFTIIKKAGKAGTNGKNGISFGWKKNENNKNPNIKTNWFVLDLGFTNYIDKTDYTFAQGGNYVRTLNAAAGAVTEQSLRLKTGKSSNVNLWIFMQKLNVSENILNLKYGLGLEMYNFRFDRNPSYRKDPNPFIFNDSIGFSKNKLYAGYLTIPFMLNINTNPKAKNAFSFSAGISAGYLISSRNKQVSDIRGKIKYKGDFDLQPFRVALVGDIGIGPIRVYGSYSLNALHKESTRLNQYPYAIGIRLSSW